MDEQNQFNLAEELDSALSEGFRKIDELDIGSDARKALHQELMENIRMRIETQKLSDEEDEHLWKEEREENERIKKEKDEQKQSRKDTVKFVVQCVLSGLGIAAPCWFSYQMFKFNTEGNFMTADQNKSVGWLFNSIKRPT